jgi:hypothetical protein
VGADLGLDVDDLADLLEEPGVDLAGGVDLLVGDAEEIGRASCRERVS